MSTPHLPVEEINPAPRRPNFDPLVFEPCGGGWYEVWENDGSSSRGYLYGYVSADGGKFEAAASAGPMSFLEMEYLYFWMKARRRI